MSPFRVVEGFDVVGHSASGRATRLERNLVEQLHLERPEEALCDRIVPAISSTTHAAGDLGLIQNIPTPLSPENFDGSYRTQMEKMRKSMAPRPFGLKG